MSRYALTPLATPTLGTFSHEPNPTHCLCGVFHYNNSIQCTFFPMLTLAIKHTVEANNTEYKYEEMDAT